MYKNSWHSNACALRIPCNNNYPEELPTLQIFRFPLPAAYTCRQFHYGRTLDAARTSSAYSPFAARSLFTRYRAQVPALSRRRSVHVFCLMQLSGERPGFLRNCVEMYALTQTGLEKWVKWVFPEQFSVEFLFYTRIHVKNEINNFCIYFIVQSLNLSLNISEFISAKHFIRQVN